MLKLCFLSAKITYHLKLKMLSENSVRNPDTQFLRAVAILLVINSHLDSYYPVPYIGTGGAIGNSLFFFLSSFGLYLSQQKNPRYFKEWVAKRIGRIYPSLWGVLVLLMLPLMILNGKLSYSTVTTFIGYFFNPPFWFLQALLVYYIVSFPFIKNKWKIKYAFLLMLILYIFSYITIVDLTRWSIEESPFDLIHYSMMFLFGICVAKKNENIVYKGLEDCLFFLLFLSLLYLHKFMILKNICIEFQFFQQLLMYPIVFYFLKISRSQFISKKLANFTLISLIVNYLAKNTLEIYMIHETISGPIKYLKMSFPVNAIVFLSLTFALSLIVNKMANVFRDKIL